MSVLCQKQTFCAAAKSLLFDHLVSLSVQRGRYGEPERLCGLEIDDQFELGRLLDRKIGRLGTFQDAIDIRCGSSEEIERVNAVRHEQAAINGTQRLPEDDILSPAKLSDRGGH